MASKPKDSLDVLQSMVNEVLVQTGKALRAANRDEASGTGQVTASLKPKIETSSTIFHAALDDIECEIIAAKSVLMRDLSALRSKKGVTTPAPVPPKQTPVPVPVIPHIPQKQAPAAPMGVDVGSPKMISTTPIRPPQLGAIQKASAAAAAAQKKESRPAAPFPDMGMDAASAIPVDLTPGKSGKTASPKVASKPNPKSGAGGASSAQGGQRPSDASTAGQGKVPASSIARIAPMGITGSSAATTTGMSGPSTSTTTTTAEHPSAAALPFTDYEFSLAPSSDPVDLASVPASASGPDPPASSSVSLMGGAVSSSSGGQRQNQQHNIAVPIPPQLSNSKPAAAAPSAPMGIGIVPPAHGMGGASASAASAGSNLTSLTAPATQQAATKKAEKPPPANDDLYNLGDGSGMDLGPDMGMGGVDTNNFDDMFFGDEGYDTAAYLGLE